MSWPSAICLILQMNYRKFKKARRKTPNSTKCKKLWDEYKELKIRMIQKFQEVIEN